MYRVLWRRMLVDLLTQIYTNIFQSGGDTSALTRAAAEIDRLLAIDPASRGESRDGAERVLIVEPLTIFFEVFEDEKTVVLMQLVYHPRI